jgi:hypothetical protein
MEPAQHWHNIGVDKMNKTKFTAIAIALMGTTALTTMSEIAYAHGGGGGGGHQGMTQKSQPLNQSHNEKGERYADKKHSGCGKVIVPTAGCATAARDPVGHTRPTLGTKKPLPGSAANNTLHPIINNKPAQPTASAPTGTGKLPPNDPVGNTHPTLGANPPTIVTVSNGVSTTQIQNGLGGVYVYSDKPGTITVSNGKESTTLPGASVTLSGNVVGVGGGQGVEVGPRNGEGKTVVAIKPPAGPTPAAPTAGGNHTTGPGSITVTTDDLKTAGKATGAVVAAPVVVDTAVGGTGLWPLGAVAAEGAAQVGATAVLPIAGAIAGYGLAKGGVSGAGDALKDSAGAVKDVTKDAAGAVKDAAKDAASAIIHLF